MIWLNAGRERIKSENPGISITEISKKAGEMWRQLQKEDKEVRVDGKKSKSLISYKLLHFTRVTVVILHFILYSERLCEWNGIVFQENS